MDHDPSLETPEIWGGTLVRSETCRCVLIENAVYLPFSADRFLDCDPQWGVYDERGYLIEFAAYRRLPEGVLVGQSFDIDLSKYDIVESSYEELTYCGPIVPHYGHFLLSSIARLWALTGKSVALFHSDPSIHNHQLAFILQYLEAAGLNPNNSISFDRPTRIPRLLVPEASLVEQKYVFKEYFDVGRRIGHRINQRSVFANKRLYLSKSKVTRGVTGFENEAYIDSMFIKAGFGIVYPEELSVSAQISLFRDAAFIAGFAGSAFHTAALVPDTECKLVIFSFDFINSNFMLLDAGMRTSATFLSVKQFVTSTSTTRFNDTFRAIDIVRLSRAMIAACIQNGASMVTKTIPLANNGQNYLDFLPQLIKRRHVKTYLEIGVNTGNMIARVEVERAIGVDPEFKIEQDVLRCKKEVVFIQETSDAFFEDKARLLAVVPNGVDLTFLDGMHQFEYLLRDFINAEANAANDGMIVLHDCLPINANMILREQSEAVALSIASGSNIGWWTGDVWKVVLILKEYRPDLLISIFDCSPTGLVCIEGLNRLDKLLIEQYDEIVSKYENMDNGLDALISYYSEIDIIRC